MKPVRVRFAPSPTGPLHIGGVRTALYNFLFAKQQKGDFVLRIEDTDRNRYVEGAEQYIIDTLQWLGIPYDEGPGQSGPFGPYRQSERGAIYRKHADRLVKSGNAYYAFDTPQDIERMRLEYTKRGVHSPKYDHTTRMDMRNSLSMSSSETEEWLASGKPYTIRLKVPEGKEIGFRDIVRGEVAFHTSELDDKVLLKADGMPTYHLANVVDDRLMEISHVIRGEEWLSSTAHHVLLYRAFGWEEDMPEFAHLPLILKPTGKGKLSKRDGQKFGFPVFPLDWEDGVDRYPGFRERGFDPAALINFLAFLGWNPGTEQELYSLDQLVDDFSLEKVVKSGARFDYDKALWFNQQHIQQKGDEELVGIVGNLFAARGIERSASFMASYIGLLKPRVTLYPDFVDQGAFLFGPVASYDRKILRKKWKDGIPAVFGDLVDSLDSGVEWNAEALHRHVSDFIRSRDLRFGDILPLIRIALSGSTKGPDLFPVMELMGRETVVRRLGDSIAIFHRLIADEES